MHFQEFPGSKLSQGRHRISSVSRPGLIFSLFNLCDSPSYSKSRGSSCLNQHGDSHLVVLSDIRVMLVYCSPQLVEYRDGFR